MNNTTKSRIFVAFVAFIMLASTAGFALFAAPARFTGDAAGGGQALQLINKRKLSSSEVLSLLNAGRVVIEYAAPPGCLDCETDRVNIEVFTNKFSGFLVLSEFPGNETRLQMTGRDGNVRQLNGTVSEESLLALLCDLAFAQPAECLLREVGREQSTMVIENPESQ